MNSTMLERVKIKYDLNADELARCEGYSDSILKAAELATNKKPDLDHPKLYFLKVCRGEMEKATSPSRSRPQPREIIKRNTQGPSPAVESSKSTYEQQKEFMAGKIKQLEYIYSLGYRGLPEGLEKWQETHHANILYYMERIENLKDEAVEESWNVSNEEIGTRYAQGKKNLESVDPATRDSMLQLFKSCYSKYNRSML